MKALRLILSLMLLAALAPAQDSTGVSDPPDVEVVKKSWRKTVRPPDLDEDPFETNDRHREAVRAQRRSAESNAVRIARGDTALPARVPSAGPPAPAPDPYSPTYVYTVKVRNSGAKTVRSLVWEYVFTDPVTWAVVGRHHYESKVKLRAGRSGELVGYSASPPARVVDARRAGDVSEGRLVERVVIYRVEYEDGSVWERSQK